MSDLYKLLSPLESIQMAWGLKLRDFRQWCAPTGQKAIRDWKLRRLEGAIIVAKSDMIDDAESMLKAVQENDNAAATNDLTNSGTSVSLPFMITAISAVESPPEREAIIGQSAWVNVIVPTDPLQRVVQLRTTPSTYRCQIAFFCSDPHAASSIANQFLNFWKHEGKRGFDVFYELGSANNVVIKEPWNFRVLENTLFPDKVDVGVKTIYGATVDCLIVGLEPTVVGLGILNDDGYYDDDITDTGEPDGSIPPGLPKVPGTRDPADELNSMVIEADIQENDEPIVTRVTIDPLTGVIIQSEINKGGTP